MTAIKAGLLVCTAMVVTLLGAAPSVAATGPEFGQHVSACAQTMGFSGTHNPGTHQGFHNWDGKPC